METKFADMILDQPLERQRVLIERLYSLIEGEFSQSPDELLAWVTDEEKWDGAKGMSL